MMESKLTIEVDHEGNPYIQVKTANQSDDLRDKLIKRFREKLSGDSCWCRVRFDDTAISGSQHFTIEPITPHQLAFEVGEMNKIVAQRDSYNSPVPH